MKKSMLQKYAQLTVRVGANVQKGQWVVVRASVDQADLVQRVVQECYRAGAVHVEVDWECVGLDRLAYRHESVKTLSDVPTWKRERMQQRLDKLPCMIYILSDDPDGMRGVNQQKMQKVRQNRYPIIKPYSDAMDNRYQWTIVGAPSVAWAKKVFPGLRGSVAVERLWQAIFDTVGLSEEADPIRVWEERNRSFEERCRKLNEFGFESMHYHSQNGTDFTVGLIPEAQWAGGGENTLSGTFFNPNLPTEEIFTTPMRGQAEGRLVATKPLSYAGQLIENFSLDFEKGRVVKWRAETGEEALEKMVTSDEGSAMLGELALVPQSSPISRSGLLFYNTLYDENASCHVALGRGFTNLIRGFETMTLEELTALGVNDSMIHVDFMIGTDDLTVTGKTPDGKEILVFHQGEWAI